MYIMFKDKGCQNCPFRTYGGPYPYEEDSFCNLSQVEDANGVPLPKIEANDDYKPKNCPFADGIQQVEVGAEYRE